MKAKGKMPDFPGFAYDARRKRVTMEVILPRTKGVKRRRRTEHASTIAEARKKWARFRESVLSGRRAEVLTVNEFLNAYWTTFAARLSKNTIRADESRLKTVIRPFFGPIQLDRVTYGKLQEFVGELRTKGYTKTFRGGRAERRDYAPAYINDALALIRKVLWFAVHSEEIPVYPIKGDRPLPRVKDPILRLELSDEERSALLGAFDDAEAFGRTFLARQGRKLKPEAVAYHFDIFRLARPVIVVALETGLRKGDLLDLRWTSVDLARGFVRLSMKKTGVEAVIPISPACREALEECQSRAKGAHVFTTDEGRKPFPEISLRRAFALAKGLAGITRRLRLNDTRHTFASRLASAGVGSHVIARALGHTSTRQTDRYAKPSEEAMGAIVSALKGTDG